MSTNIRTTLAIASVLAASHPYSYPAYTHEAEAAKPYYTGSHSKGSGGNCKTGKRGNGAVKDRQRAKAAKQARKRNRAK